MPPWTNESYPPALGHLPDPVRGKAVEIANALLREGMDEGRCIRIAIAQAGHWWLKQQVGAAPPP